MTGASPGPGQGPTVMVIVVAYNSAADIEACLRSLEATRSRRAASVRIVVVDNASADDTVERVRGGFPGVLLIHSDTNLGFAGGNNLGFARGEEELGPPDYLCLVNPDAEVEPGWLDPLLEAMEADPSLGAAQPKILLTESRGEDPPRFDTAGNRSNYLGFGYVTAHDEPDRGQYDGPRALDFASGACMILRGEAVRRHGLFDESMFLYLEDTELCWKLKSVGYGVAYVPDSVVWHAHDPEGTFAHYRYLERNRWWVVLAYYKWPTLLINAPMFALMEVGTLVHAAKTRHLGDKLRAYGDLARLIPELRRKRARVQRERTEPDRSLLGNFSGRIEAAHVDHGVMGLVVNPVIDAWWNVTRRLMTW